MTMSSNDASKLLVEFVGALTLARVCATFPEQDDFNRVASENLENGIILLFRGLVGEDPELTEVERLAKSFLTGPASLPGK